MNFNEFLYISELGFLIEAPVLTTPAIGIDSIYTDPKTGKAWRPKQKLMQLKVIRNKFRDSDLYVHFSDGVNSAASLSYQPKSTVPKLGINPNAVAGGTPIGIYAYPIDYVINNFDNYGGVPYGNERKFMLVFKVEKKHMLYVKKDDGEDLTDLRQIKDLLMSQNTKIQELTEKKMKYFIRVIKSIENNMSSDLAEEKIPNVLYTHIVKKIYRKVNHMLIANEWDDSNYETLSAELKKTAKFYENLDRYFADDKYSVYEYLLMKYAPAYKIDEEKIDFDKFTFEIKGITGNITKKSLLEEFGENSSTVYPSVLNTICFYILKNLVKKSVLEKFEKKILKLNEKIKELLLNLRKKREQAIENFEFPFKNEFKKIIEENGLNLLDVFIELIKTWNYQFGNNPKNETNNFIYKFTGTLSHKIIEKNHLSKSNKYYVVWTSLLRRLGFKGVVDDEDTATIHSGEKTQAVFFDPAQIKLIAVLLNTNANNTWNSNAGRKWRSEDSALMRWFKEFKSKKLNDNYYFPSIENSTHGFQKLVFMFASVNNLIIFLISYFRFAEKIEKERPLTNQELKTDLNKRLNPDAYNGLDAFLMNYDNKISQIKNSNLINYSNILYDIMQKIQKYIKSNEIKTNLPKPSHIREIIKNLKMYNL